MAGIQDVQRTSTLRSLASSRAAASPSSPPATPEPAVTDQAEISADARVPQDATADDLVEGLNHNYQGEPSAPTTDSVDQSREQPANADTAQAPEMADAGNTDEKPEVQTPDAGEGGDEKAQDPPKAGDAARTPQAGEDEDDKAKDPQEQGTNKATDTPDAAAKSNSDQDAARQVVDQHSRFPSDPNGTLRALNQVDGKGLGKDLNSMLPDQPGVVDQALKRAQSMDDAQAINTSPAAKDAALGSINGKTDGELANIAETPEGKAALQQVAESINQGQMKPAEAQEVMRAARVAMPQYAGVLNENVTPEVQKSLDQNGVKLQKISDGAGPLVLDQFSMRVNKMPDGVTPEEFLKRFAANPNGVAGNSTFDSVNTFARRTDAPPQVGDLVDIDILGPKKGSVVIKDMDPSHFTFGVVNDPSKYGEHPEYGNREFGFNKNEDGSVDFYTRGASRSASLVPGDNGALVGGPGILLQSTGWPNMLRGMGETINRMGGQADSEAVKIDHPLQAQGQAQTDRILEKVANSGVVPDLQDLGHVATDWAAQKAAPVVDLARQGAGWAANQAAPVVNAAQAAAAPVIQAGQQAAVDLGLGAAQVYQADVAPLFSQAATQAAPYVQAAGNGINWTANQLAPAAEVARESANYAIDAAREKVAPVVNGAETVGSYYLDRALNSWHDASSTVKAVNRLWQQALSWRP